MLLDGGRVVVEGPPDEVLTEENLRRYYGARVRIIRDGGRPVVLPIREERHDRSPDGPRPMPTEHVHPELRRVESVVVREHRRRQGQVDRRLRHGRARRWRRGWNVAVVQFLKSGKWQVGEEKVCRDRLGVDWFAIGEGFTWDSADLSEDEAVAQAAWRHAAG